MANLGHFRTVIIAVFGMVALLLNLSLLSCVQQAKAPSCSEEESRAWVKPVEWLYKRISLKEADRVVTENGSSYSEKRWVKIKSQLEEGDELWLFSAPHERWQERGGEFGIVVLRRCSQVHRLLLVVS